MHRLRSWAWNAVYLAALAVLGPWLVYRWLWRGKRSGSLRQRWWGLVPRREGDAPCIWFHAVSVGEVNVLVPLVDRLRRQWPACQCVVSATTRSGYELARRRFGDHLVFVCPHDVSWAVRAALRRIRPTVLVLAELELWPNLIGICRQTGVGVAVVNGRLSQASWRGYRRCGPLARSLFRSLDVVLAQTAEYAERFENLGTPADRIGVTGSIKFDGAVVDRHNAATERLAELCGLAATDVVWLAGSTQAEDESVVFAAYAELQPRFPRLRLMVAPRHIERSDYVIKAITDRQWRAVRRTDLAPGRTLSADEVLVIDTVGELAAWWGVAHIAFVGGSLGRRGGQNMIEPAALGCAVSFGPATQNFRDVVAMLLRAEAAVVVEDADELARFVERCVTDAEFCTELGNRARRLVASQTGGADRTIAALMKLVQAIPARRIAA